MAEQRALLLMPDIDGRTPFDEDTAAHRVAASFGFELVRRYRAIDITDEKALIAAGYTTSKPKLDFGAIARALESGADVAGAQWRGMEYVMRVPAPKEAPKEAA